LHYAEGNIDNDLNLMKNAADREDGVSKHPVTPGEVIPARELFADMLYAINHHQEALANYEAELQHSPNRYNALLGAARSASALANQAVAKKYYGILHYQVSGSESNREGNAEAQRYLVALEN
jgi:hypothetical protein